MDKPIIFFGSGLVAKASLEFLLLHFEVEAIITKPATESEMVQIASNIPVYSVQNAAELDELMAKQTFHSKLGVLVDFGVIVSKKVIDYFSIGIINSHFSLLPKLRGADPITFAILEGHEKTGASLMLIDEKMDTGKLIGQKTLHISPDETTPSLTAKLIDLSNAMLVERLPRYVMGDLKPQNQPHTSRATYTRKLTKEDGVVDWSKPAEQIEREVRAYLGWPGSHTTLTGKDIIITKAHVEKSKDQPVRQAHDKRAKIKVGEALVTPTKKLVVMTGDGKLVIENLKPAGKKEMSAAEFIRGYIR